MVVDFLKFLHPSPSSEFISIIPSTTNHLPCIKFNDQENIFASCYKHSNIQTVKHSTHPYFVRFIDKLHKHTILSDLFELYTLKSETKL